MVRLYGTFSNYIFTEETRCAGCSYTSSGWFKHSSNLLEPHHDRDSRACRVLSYEFGVVRLYRIFSNYIFTGETRCAGCSCTSSGGSSASNFLEPSRTTSSQRAGCLCTSLGWFKRIEPPRTFSNHIIAEIARCVEVFFFFPDWWFFSFFKVCRVLFLGSGWFDSTELSQTTSLQAKKGA